MDKQEEIIEGIKDIVQNGVCQDFSGVDIGTVPQDIIEYLHSRGVRLPDGKPLIKEVDNG